MSVKGWAAWPVVIIGAASLAACGSGADDAATTQDAKFLAAIKHDGLPHDSSMNVWSAAKKVCEQMDQGQTADYEAAVVAAVPRDQATVNDVAAPYFTAEQSRAFVNEAIAFYCPKYKDQLLK